MNGETETLPGIDEGGRVSPTGLRFAQVRAQFPENKQFSNARCYAMAIGLAEDAPLTDSHMVMAAKMMKQRGVVNYINVIRAQQGKRLALKADAVLADIVEIKEQCLGRIPTVRTVVDDAGDEQVVFRHEIDRGTALKSLELIAKHLGLWKDKVELTGADGGAIQTVRRVEYVGVDSGHTDSAGV